MWIVQGGSTWRLQSLDIVQNSIPTPTCSVVDLKSVPVVGRDRRQPGFRPLSFAKYLTLIQDATKKAKEWYLLREQCNNEYKIALIHP